ncbi:MAG: sigma-70 family RNA polymerase sigma factor [Nocardioidaceae bacterium]
MDKEFFTEFYEDMRPKITRFIRARFPFEMAEDLANDTMVTLLRHDPPTPTDEVELRQLRSFAYQAALGHILNAERRLVTEEKLGPTVVADVTLRIQCDTQDPTFEAVLPQMLADAVAELPEVDRQAVSLMAAGLKTGEIADILAIPFKTASMRLSRARRRLRELLTEKGVIDNA